MAKVKQKQKVSGCFRTELYAQAYCRISSYLQTMANQGVNLLIAIQMALAGEVGGSSYPGRLDAKGGLKRLRFHSFTPAAIRLEQD